MVEEPVVLPSRSNPSSTSNMPEEILRKPQVPGVSGLPSFPNGDLQILPIMYPVLVPGLQDQEQMNRGPGLYAVPVHSFMGPVTGFSSNALIPLTYNVPTTRSSPDVATGGEPQGQDGQQQPQQQQPQQQHAGPHRRVVVRRFQIQFRLDPVLILKLIALLLLFNQEGSRQKMVVLVICASIVYLYKTGSLAPLIEWLSRAMDRAAVPPQPPRPAARVENAPPAERQGNDDAALADGLLEHEEENRPADADENAPDPGANGGNHWWGIVKEIQMIVFGFITSLLPGFHDIE